MNTTQSTQSTPDAMIAQALGQLWTPPADMMEPIRKVIDLGEDPQYDDSDTDSDTDSARDRADIPRVFLEIEIWPTDTEHGRRGILSIVATMPGACGQIREIVGQIEHLSPGWTPALRDELLAVWERDHLRAISPEVYTWIMGLPTGAEDLPASGYDADGPIESHEVTARRFLTRWGIRSRLVHAQAKEAPWHIRGRDHGSRARHWTVTLMGPTRLRFDFWSSQHDTERGRPLSLASVLSCLASDLQYHEDHDSVADLVGAESAWDVTPEQQRQIDRVIKWAARIDTWVSHVEAARPGFRASLEAHCR